MSRGFRYFAQETLKKNSLENLKRKQKQLKKTKKHQKKLPDPWVHRAETFVLVWTLGRNPKKTRDNQKTKKLITANTSRTMGLQFWCAVVSVKSICMYICTKKVDSGKSFFVGNRNVLFTERIVCFQKSVLGRSLM